MGSLGGEAVNEKKAMWLYPKVLGFNPCERWGHSACCADRAVYVFGGCCGGLHFGDVLKLDLETMVWSSLATTGLQSGSRDSHSAVLIGHKLVIFGGTNGSRKVNDLHLLDLRKKEWSRPHCEGSPPSPRESHTATAVGDDKVVIFGGSGEGGKANYLNDVHILDLKTMTWSSPKVKGDLPAPRDSHTAVAIDNRLLVYGGDCGDRYHGEVDILDMDTLTWSRLSVQGSSPGARAGHAAVKIGTKVYVIGGVGDKNYYGDVWVLDVNTCSWARLDITGQQPQGRFSHSAVVTDSDIVVYGGCGEDERPLNELLILQLGSEHPNGRYNITMCKIFGNHWSPDKRRILKEAENMTSLQKKSMVLVNGESDQRAQVEAEPKNLLSCGFDDSHAKRRRLTSDSKSGEIESEQEEHSLSLSQHSSPSQSDQEQNNTRKLISVAADSKSLSGYFVPFKSHHATHHCHPQNNVNNHFEDHQHPACSEPPRQSKAEQFLRAIHPGHQEMQFTLADQKPQLRAEVTSLMEAEVHGTIDGTFDSGYLLTASVNGHILRGVLFAPGPGVAVSRAAVLPQNTSLTSPIIVSQPNSSPTHRIPVHARLHRQMTTFVPPESGHNIRQAQSVPGINAQSSRLSSSDLKGVLLTLGGPGGSCSA